MWNGIYARLVATLGWTWEYIDTCMTVPRLLALTEHWQESPPLHEAFAAFMDAFSGTERTTRRVPGGASEAGTEDTDNFGQFMQAFGGLGGVVAVN